MSGDAFAPALYCEVQGKAEADRTQLIKDTDAILTPVGKTFSEIIIIKYFKVNSFLIKRSVITHSEQKMRQYTTQGS